MTDLPSKIPDTCHDCKPGGPGSNSYTSHRLVAVVQGFCRDTLQGLLHTVGMSAGMALFNCRNSLPNLFPVGLRISSRPLR